MDFTEQEKQDILAALYRVGDGAISTIARAERVLENRRTAGKPARGRIFDMYTEKSLGARERLVRYANLVTRFANERD